MSRVLRNLITTGHCAEEVQEVISAGVTWGATGCIRHSGSLSADSVIAIPALTDADIGRKFTFINSSTTADMGTYEVLITPNVGQSQVIDGAASFSVAGGRTVEFRYAYTNNFVITNVGAPQRSQEDVAPDAGDNANVAYVAAPTSGTHVVIVDSTASTQPGHTLAFPTAADADIGREIIVFVKAVHASTPANDLTIIGVGDNIELSTAGMVVRVVSCGAASGWYVV